MKKILALVAVSALALPSFVSASVFGCDGCTPQQMYDTAWSNLYSPGVRPGYIVNLANGTVAKYANIANIPDPYDPEPPPYEPNIIAVPVEPEIASLVHDLSVLTNGNTRVVTDTSGTAGFAPAAKAAASTSSDDRLPVNAYESALSPALEANVAETVRRETQDIALRIANAAAIYVEIKYFVLDPGFPLNVTFVFREGGLSQYRYDTLAGRWIYIPKTARDARGNPVPDDAGQVCCNGDLFDFTTPGPPNDIDWFRWLAESFGVTVIDMRSNGSAGGIVCVDGACYIQNR